VSERVRGIPQRAKPSQTWQSEIEEGVKLPDKWASKIAAASKKLVPLGRDFHSQRAFGTFCGKKYKNILYTKSITIRI